MSLERLFGLFPYMFKGGGSVENKKNGTTEKVMFDLLNELSEESRNRIVADMIDHGIGLDFKNRKFYKLD